MICFSVCMVWYGAFCSFCRYFAAAANDSEKAHQDALFRKILDESYTFHFWNSLTSALIPEPESLVARILNRHCIRCFDVLWIPPFCHLTVSVVALSSGLLTVNAASWERNLKCPSALTKCCYTRVVYAASMDFLYAPSCIQKLRCYSNI